MATEEDRLLEGVLEIVGELQLRWHHDPDSRRSGSRGFPDLIIAGPGGILAVELKSRGGVLTPNQRQWGSWLTRGGMVWTIWRPRDLADGTVRRMLETIALRM